MTESKLMQESIANEGGSDQAKKDNLHFLDVSKLVKEEASCDLCGKKEEKVVHSVTYFNVDFRFVQCQTCSLIYQSPRLNRESLLHLYGAIEYWEHKRLNQASEPMTNYYSYADSAPYRTNNAQFRSRWIKKYLEEQASILDVGCADGLFVHVLGKNGYQASGIDISPVMVKEAKERYGVDAHQLDFEQDWAFDKKFDAITCFATTGNFFNPSRVFKNFSKYLKGGGYLFLNFSDVNRLVPRLLNRARYLCRPSCGTMYSLRTMRAYLDRFGFDVVSVSNDHQCLSFAQIFGFMGFKGSLRKFQSSGLDRFNVQLAWPTGYLVCARRRKEVK